MMLVNNTWVVFSILFLLVGSLFFLPDYFKYQKINNKKKEIRKNFMDMFYSNYLIDEINRMIISTLGQDHIGELNELSDVFDYMVSNKKSQVTDHISKRLYGEYIFLMLKNKGYTFKINPVYLKDYVADYDLSLFRADSYSKISCDYDIASHCVAKINDFEFFKESIS